MRKKSVSRPAIGGLALAIAVIGVWQFNARSLLVKPAAAVIPPDVPVLAPEDAVHAGYAGSDSCRKCHAAEFEKWHGSHHGMAERNISAEPDHQAFSPKQTLVHGKDTSEMFLDASGLAKILTLGLDKQRHVYQPVCVIGHHPLRQFLIPAPGGRMQTCDVSLDPANNEWFDVYGDEERGPGDWGHWTGQGMNWNAMCAACHNTRLRKNYEPRSNSYHTSMAEMSVGCESCHGPLKEHVTWQDNKPPVGTSKDPTVKKLTRDQMLETCAACHARRGELTGDLVPGESFYDHFSLTVTDETDIYHPDGQVRDENYEFTSFLSSRMHAVGVRCVDCHDPHTGKRLVPGNQLCMNCHTAPRADFPTAPVIDPVAHSRHGSESSGNQCTSCHMPVTTYMQRHPRHDHSFSIPDPRLTRETGTPNACNRCHTDKDTDWAIGAYQQLYGEKKPDRPSRTRALLVAAARRGEPAARDGMVRLLESPELPAWKASACRLLERWVNDPAVMNVLLARTADPSPLVREAAVRALTAPARENNRKVRDTLQPLLDDSIRSVRIAAAWALCESLDLNSRAGKELVHMLDLNADQPTGRMQLSQFAMRRGDPAAAVRQIRKAIEWDPNSPPFHHDLAILLSTTGDAPGAVNAMRDAIRLDPENAEYFYKLALALNETGSTAEATAALEKTVKLDHGYARAWYNLGLAYSGGKQPQRAIAALREAEKADSNDAEIPYARATIHAQLGQKQEAIEAAARALQLRPDYAEARQLLGALAP